MLLLLELTKTSSTTQRIRIESFHARGDEAAFWSAFILVGNDHPIQLAKQNKLNYSLWIIAGLGFLGAGIGYRYWKKRDKLNIKFTSKAAV